MKKAAAILQVLVLAVMLMACTEHITADNETGAIANTPALTTIPVASTNPNPTMVPTEIPTTTATNESILSSAEQILIDDPLFVKCEIDDIKLVATFRAPEGTNDGFDFYFSDVTLQQSWASYVESMRGLSKEITDFISRSGGVQIGAVYIQNDLNPDAILLACANGKVIYNFVDELE